MSLLVLIENKHKYMFKKWSIIYQPCSGSQLTCFRGFSIGNFIILYYFIVYQILEESVMSGRKILQNHENLFSHIFGSPWVRECGCKLSNKRVQKPHCLSPPCPLLFFPLRLAWTCGVSPHTLRLTSPSASCATAHLISHTNARKHTPRWCGSETQPECDRTLLRYASRKIEEGRASPIHPKTHHSNCDSL